LTPAVAGANAPFAAYDARQQARPPKPPRKHRPAGAKGRHRTTAVTTAASPGQETAPGAALLTAQHHGGQLAAQILTLKETISALKQEKETLASRVTWLEGKNGQLQKDLDEMQRLLWKASARVDELEPDNIRLRTRVGELEKQLAAAPASDPGPVAAAAPDPATDPEPAVPDPAPRRSASWEEMLAMGGPVTGPCAGCT
jgi:septal ring factor EnvC (AmiA/AmiB activator)